MDVRNGVKHIEWHDVKLPIYSVHNTTDQYAVALVIEGEDISQRFALMCKTMPLSVRLRISEIVDEIDERQEAEQHPTIFKYVRMQDRRYHIPNLEYIEKTLGL